MTPDDVDLVETSAPFTFLNMIMLEDLGFCEKGEGKDFVAGGGSPSTAGCRSIRTGAISVSARRRMACTWRSKPCSSCASRRGGRQVPDSRNALVHFHGGPNAAHSVILLSSEDDP